INDLEKEKDLPKQKWLEITDGYAFVPQNVRHVQKDKSGKEIKVNAYYVPLLSKATAEEWVTTATQRGPGGPFSYKKCRIVVKLTPEQHDKLLPKDPKVLKDPKDWVESLTPVKGTVFSETDKEVRNAIADQTATEVNFDNMLFVEHEGTPAGKALFI